MIDFTPKEYKIFDQSVSIPKSTPEWVDLGLPSGNLWKFNNESKLFTFKEASKFSKQLPSMQDWEELIVNTRHFWDTKRNGLIILKGSQDLFFPAEGCFNPYVGKKGEIVATRYGYYLSSTKIKRNSLGLAFGPSFFHDPCRYDYNKIRFDSLRVYDDKYSVRLIQRMN